MGEMVNIMEKIASSFLELALALRYDICTCPGCRKKMLSYVLEKIPAKYVDTATPHFDTIYKQMVKEYGRRVIIVVYEAIDVVSRNVSHIEEEDREADFQLLLDRIYQDRGMDLREYHRKLLQRRIALRMNACKVNTYSQYLRILIENPREYEKLFEVLTINVSEFFRDPPVWKGLREVLAELILKKRRRGDSLVIWSAGCAGGEEPYSVAILLREMGVDRNNLDIKIYGTDVDRGILEEAKEGKYKKNKVRNVPGELLEKYFSFSGEKYKLKDEIEKMVEFKWHDLISSKFLENVDVIICRNVFIYFTRTLQEQILSKFYESLNDYGYLVIGLSETILSEARLVFKEVNLGCRIYQKIVV